MMRRDLLLATAALLCMYLLALHSLLQKSPTFDEQGFLVRGVGYLRGEKRDMRVGHPLGLNALNGLLLWRDETVRLPTDDPSWQRMSFHRPAELFLWEIGNDVEHIMLLGRLPTVWLGLLLAAVCGRFAREASGERRAGLLALLLVAFDPNVLAHMRLTTTDLGLTAATALATYLLWRYLLQPSWPRVIWLGVGFALLQDTKFSAGLFVPLFALTIAIAFVVRWRRQRRLPAAMLVQLVIAFPLIAFVTLWGLYGFDSGTLPQQLPVLTDVLGGRTLPLAHHIEQLTDIGGRVLQSTPAFLHGRYSDSGWWYYFPIALLVKTPLPTLLLVLIGAIAVVRRRPATITLAVLTIVPLGFLAIALTNEINIGYRHVLPIVPLLIVGASVQLAPLTQGRRPSLPIWLLTGWLVIESLLVAPHFLAYFNQIAAGPDGGWRWLVDSNLDWGQDLAALARWQDEENAPPLFLSYFGEARPDYYGIDYVGLPSNPPRLMRPDAVSYDPARPLAGLYAISATNLQGPLFDDHDLFAPFRDREPIAKIGYSIFIYEVEATGAPVALSLGSMQLQQLSAHDYRRLNSNDLRLRWFDASQALLLPSADSAFVAGLPIELRYPLQWSVLYAWGEPLSTVGAYTMFAATPQDETIERLIEPTVDVDLALGSGRSTLQRYTFERDHDAITVYSLWLQQGEPQPLKLFVHVEDAAGAIVAQWDGFGAVASSWAVGDRLLQISRIALPPALLEVSGDPQRYDLWLGMYDPASGERWQHEGGDRYHLGMLFLP